jgi:hypothetical protein
MRIVEVLFLLGISAVAVVLCLHGWLVAGHGPTVILPPAGIAAVLVILASLRLLRTLRLEAGDAEDDLQRQYWEELSGSVGPLLWCLAVPPLLLLLGYPLGLALFVAGYVRAHGGSWTASLLGGGGAGAVVWFGAKGALGVPVPLLPGWW